MAPTSSEIFNSKLIEPTFQIIEDLGPSPLGSDPLRASSLESTSPTLTPPVLVPRNAPLPIPASNLLSKSKLIRVASQPIPLRTLTTLLNYERVTSDWRYQNLSLYHGSEMESRKVEESDTVYTEGARCFCYDNSPCPPDQQTWRQTTCRVHPEAPPETRLLGSTQLERALYESRGAEWDPGCELMYQLFFKFCGKDQQLKIQIRDERPVLVNASEMLVLQFGLIDPRHRNLNGEHEMPDGVFHTLMLGSCEGSVLVFPPLMENLGRSSNGERIRIGWEDCIVVDMLHMRYGKKGLFEEPYFLGSVRQWVNFMCANVCADLDYHRMEKPDLTRNQQECSERLWDWFYKHSLRAFQRWIANAQEPNLLWCDYCGIGGARFIRCCGEGDEMTRYCSEEHRQRGWALHRFTCKNKAEDM